MPAFAKALKRIALLTREQDHVWTISNPADPTGSRSNASHRGPHSRLFHPGDSVLESGIYEVVHDAQHRSAHEVVMIADDHFPTCDTCLDRVRFRLVRTAPYIFSDQDFEEEK